ncbi:MAG TPA: hypothetical protein VMZ33_01875 [Candidatus Limnocylindrales bacterium]|nr:hypothetical protein [Candidatus Limnocylindrales bacterium]
MDEPTADVGEWSAERVALNDATFRNANEGIEERAESLDVDPVPFLCECADMTCTEVIRLSLKDYEEIRSDSTHFLNVPGHQVAAGPHGKVVAEREGYVIVQKIGRAGEIVADLDERSAEERAS